ncbi:MAG: TIGR02678 family protein [Rhodospirillales bacterium]|nr:TIGR02678 family protein [Rhodospirillales bacterium]
MKLPSTSAGISEVQQRHQREEFRIAVRALLMRPLMGPQHPDFPAVRRQTERLRDWFARETGWPLHVDREGARLYKRPADLWDTTRGLPDYDRRRYVLLCLSCAVLERADPQITLHVLGEKLLALAVEPVLAARGFTYSLSTQSERRDLVTVCRTLLDLGVLQRVVGDEEGFVMGGGGQADALYDVQRRTLADFLAVVRGPSTWRPEDAPATLEQRLEALVAEHVPDSDEGHRTALRHHLSRRLMDDPVIYTETLAPDTQNYFVNQRGAMAARLCEATGLVAEQRAEGLALTDEDGALTDVAMPAEGTEAHATLLVAEHLAQLARHSPTVSVDESSIVTFLAEAKERFGRYWRRSAREPGGERELTEAALRRLSMLRLIDSQDGRVRPLPALARFALGEADIRSKSSSTFSRDD